jgi:hypothetical protein
MLHHQPGPDVEVAVGEHLAEGEVVEALDQFVSVWASQTRRETACRGCDVPPR